jgi:hypothetical protein
VITHGSDTYIIPKSVYDLIPKAKANPQVEKNISRMFETIEHDDAIQNFGLTPHVSDPEPLIQFPREDFPKLAQPPAILAPDNEISRRSTEHEARLVILKAWMKPGRKWSFEWNGVPVSAPITDAAFLGRFSRREFLLGVGDALDVVLRFQQTYDEDLGLWVNDHGTYEIVKVIRPVSHGGTQSTIFDDD